MLAASALSSSLLFAGAASAVDPVLRHQEDTRGDVVVFGSSLAFDCGSGIPAPAGAVASCAGQLNIDDTAPDLYFRDSAANSSVQPLEARTSATLSLPAGAVVTYARLYWSALKVGQTADTDAILDWLGGPQQTITADDSWVVSYGFLSHPDWYYYQATGDATDFVATWGAGDFRVSGVDALPLAGVTVDRAFSAWTLVVFYEAPGEELRNLALFDGFTPIDPGMVGQGSAEVKLSGFVVPQGFTARMSAFTYEGDKGLTGDHFTFNGGQQADQVNPFDDFFNSSRSSLGAPVSGDFDVPKFTGEPGTMGGYDLDTIDVTELLQPGDTSATVGADSSLDIFFLGGFVTSVTNLAPQFAVTKSFKDLNGGGVKTGDVLEFSISGTNTGNDTAKDVIVTDAIGAGMTYVPGSLKVSQSGKTDAAGDDAAEWKSSPSAVTFFVGSGAAAGKGGTVAPGGSVEVTFQVTVTAKSGETITNQAILGAAGQAGSPHKDWPSDSDPQKVGPQELSIPVDQCASDAQCSGDTPVCDVPNSTCVGCKSDADCKDPKAPACQKSGACGECSATNPSLCTGATPVCDAMTGTCEVCTSMDTSACVGQEDGPQCVGGMNGMPHCGCFGDADCGGAQSGKVCDPNQEVCVDGCKGEAGNGCPEGQMCSSTDSSVGTCSGQTGGSGGSGAGGAGNGGASGAGGGDDPSDKGPCACSLPGMSRAGSGAALALAGLMALGLRRRKRRSNARTK